MAERMKLSDVLEQYRDGDGHGWDTEFKFLWREHIVRLEFLAHSIRESGIREPILLGNDGRVWDGHHRLCVAVALGLDWVPVERVSA